MKRQIFNIFSVLIIVLALFGSNVQVANASTSLAPSAALPNPGAKIPVQKDTYARYTKGPHLSGFKMGYITNPGKVTSSVDLGYNGKVTAPISGTVMIAKSCKNGQQIVFINADRDKSGVGWSIGLTHIHIDSSTGIKEGSKVTQDQIIGQTVRPPKADDGQGCGYGSDYHIHYTLMKWQMSAKGPTYTEQNIVNTYLDKWIVKNTFLEGPTIIQIGGVIK